MIVSLIQNAPTLSKIKNKTYIKEQIQKYKNSNLLIFPELSLSGYMLKDGVFDDCFDENEILDLFKDTKQDIICSCAFMKKNKILNCGIYISNSKIVHIHYKNHLPNHTFFQESRFFSRGKKIQSFDTKFGKMLIVICEDLWNGKTLHKIQKQKPDIVVVLSASPSRDFDNDLHIKKQWDGILQTTTLIAQAYCFFVNRVGFEDGLGFWGGSKVILPNAKIHKECKLFEEDSIDFEIKPNSYVFDKYIGNLK